METRLNNTRRNALQVRHERRVNLASCGHQSRTTC